MALTCLKIGGEMRWKFDANTSCLSSWQYVYIIVSIFYVIPFFAIFSVGVKNLHNKLITPMQFLVGSFFPLPFLFIQILSTLFHKNKLTTSNKTGCMSKIEPSNPKIRICLTKTQEKGVNILQEQKDQGDGLVDKPHVVQSDQEREQIIEALEGPYKSGGWTQYWESVMELRRLLLNLTIFIDDLVLQMLFCLCLCILFSSHHSSVYPFRKMKFNRLETVSLSMLCLICGINLMKALLIAQGFNDQNKITDLMGTLVLVENLSLFFILLGFLIVEFQQVTSKTN